MAALLWIGLVVHADAAPQAGVGPEGNRSPYKGKIVADPEGMSGLWEAPNEHGGVVGIHLILGTTVDPYAKTGGRTLKGVEQQWEYLEIGVYEQKGAEFTFGDENYFSDRPTSSKAGDFQVKIEDDHLKLHFVSRVMGTPAFDLDLRKVEGDRWAGRFHRGSFDEQVTLERPGAGLKRANGIPGTWTTTGFPEGHIHIGEQGPGRFVGWADTLQIPGTIRFGPSVHPHRLFELYGSRVKVQKTGEESFSFEFGAYSGICCSYTFVGKLSSGGATLEGVTQGGNHQPTSDKWTRMEARKDQDSSR